MRSSTPYEGWDTGLRRIKDSLSAKVFLGMFCALTLCSLVVYGIVMLVIPNQYTS